MAPQRKTIAIDFDGVIHQYDRGWYDGEIYGEPVPGAFEMMAKLQQDYDLYILTTRATPETWYRTNGMTVFGVEAIRQWLEDKGAGEKLVNIPITNVKRAAIAYIDDRAVRFTNWPDVRKMFQ